MRHHATALSRFVLLTLFLTPVQLFPQVNSVTRTIDAQPRYYGMQFHPSQPVDRPKVGLVLSGGGGRGLAQIGVLRVLERNHIPIDLIVGNSLGCVVGGLYASGYTTAEIESIALHTNWSELLSFSEETKRTDLFVGQKQTEQRGFLLIRFDGLEPIIPSSVSGGQRLSNFFSYLTLQALYHPNPTFDNLKIPFRAIATDLISGKRVVLDRGSLAEAMRASVTVPLLYSPIEKDSMFMVDGGLTSNIPVDVAKSLGCDVVIVVNSTSGMRTASQMTAPWEIADQIMTIMMQKSNQDELKLADVVITPPADNRIVSDFSGIDTLIAAGERATDESIPKIQDIIAESTTERELLSRDSLSQVEMSRQSESDGSGTRVYADALSSEAPTSAGNSLRRPSPIESVEFTGNHLVADSIISREVAGLKGVEPTSPEVQKTFEQILTTYRQSGYSLARIDSVRFDTTRNTLQFRIQEGRIAQIRYEGNEKTRDYVIRREFPMDEGDIFNIDEASQGIVNIRSTGLFDYVLLDVRYNQAQQPVVILKVKEKSSELMRLGFHADNEHGVVSAVDIRDANFRGAWEDFGIEGQYGYRDRSVNLGYTINRIFNTYLTFSLNTYAKSSDVNVFGNDPAVTGDSWKRIEVGRYRQTRYGAALDFGSHMERFGDVTGELRWENQKISDLSGKGPLPEQYQLVSLKLQSIIDNENKFSFPTSGMYLGLSYESALKGLGSDVGFGKFNLTYENYLTLLPRHTIRPKFIFGFADETLPLAEQYRLGGFNSFLGLRDDDSRGRQLFLVSMEYRFWFPFKLIFETYVKVRYDLGTISTVRQELKLSNFYHGLGTEVALDTPLGQVSVGAGEAFHREVPNSPFAWGPLLLYFSIGPNL